MDLNRSRPDPSILRPVAYQGNRVIGHAVRNHSTHAWVGPDGVGMLMTFASVFDGDDRRLAIFDEALATAAWDPGWDPDFNKLLFPEPGEGWHVYPGMVRLLRYGHYPEDLLIRAGDNILLGGTDRREEPIGLEDNVSAARMVL